MLVLLAAGAFVLLSLPVAWKTVTGPVRESLFENGGKALLFVGLFTVYHIWLTMRLIRFR